MYSPHTGIFTASTIMHNDTNRLSRLTAILTQLQTKRLITATELAAKFNVSIRTIYRDIRALERSGVPVLTEEGKGYSLMDGYRVPPVMFTEQEANALITAEQLVVTNGDISFVKSYTEAIQKIKAVLRHSTRENVELLANRMIVSQNDEKPATNHLAILQIALTGFKLITIEYLKPDAGKISVRTVEPFALMSTQQNWLLLAYCRLRKKFRVFRLDRILSIVIQEGTFTPHQMTLQDYFAKTQKKN